MNQVSSWSASEFEPPVKRRRWQPSRLLTLGVFSLVLLAAGPLALTYRNHQAASLISAARRSIEAGKYDEAAMQLTEASSHWMTPATRKRFKALSADDARWQGYAKLQQSADTLIQAKDYPGAIAALEKITDHRFPGYQKSRDSLALAQAKQSEGRPVTQPTKAKSPPAPAGFQIAGPASRQTADLPDDHGGYQIHILYVLPSDGADSRYDTSGGIATSVSAWENWLFGQTGGKTLRLDTYHDKLDVTFVRLDHTEQEIRTGSDLPWAHDANRNPYVRDDLKLQLSAKGFNQPKKLYAIFYDGSSNYSCGGGAYPPTISDHYAAEYLHGGDPAYPDCGSNHLATDYRSPGYLDFDILHETMHTLGMVPSCAPHQVLSGHSGDTPRDLMWSGSQPWGIAQGLVLDQGHDDYYGHGRSDCLDLTRSAFLTAGGTELPPNW